MKGRTYRYFEGMPLYPFGYGLSYTTFSYGNIMMPETIRAGDSLRISVEVTNSGDMAGDEVVQLYLTDVKGSTPRPIRQLEGFTRIHLKEGETSRVEFTLAPRQFSMINDRGERVIEPGDFIISIGGCQPDSFDTTDPGTGSVISSHLRVNGNTINVPEQVAR
jgi:beta-glucosidase